MIWRCSSVASRPLKVAAFTSSSLPGKRAPHRTSTVRQATQEGSEPDDIKKTSEATSDSSRGSSAVSEDVIAKLRQFEEENQRLKKQLESQGSSKEVEPVKRAARIDGAGLERETIFGNRSRGNWISEADVDFFAGSGPTEDVPAAGLEMSKDDQDVVKRRLAIGALLAAGVSAFALIPTESLDGSASKATSAYLVPVLRSMALLRDLATELDEGSTASVKLVVTRVLSKPNEARRNMYSAIEALPPSQRQGARELIGNFVDLVQQVDYNTYYDTVGTADGRAMAQYMDFSAKSARTAVREAESFLRLFPGSDVREARAALAM